MYSDDKDDARREAIVNYILYGVSLAAAVFVYIAVSLVILVTRMKQYKDIIRVMRNAGADKGSNRENLYEGMYRVIAVVYNTCTSNACGRVSCNT